MFTKSTQVAVFSKQTMSTSAQGKSGGHQYAYRNLRALNASSPPSSSVTISVLHSSTVPSLAKCEAEPFESSTNTRSASPKTGMFGLWVTKMSCRRLLTLWMLSTTASKMNRLSRLSSGWSTINGFSLSSSRIGRIAVHFCPVEREPESL